MKVSASVAGVAIFVVALAGCGASNALSEMEASDTPTSVVQAVFSERYDGGTRPAGLSDADWQDQSSRAIFAAAGAHGVTIFQVEWTQGSDDITVDVVGDPHDNSLLLEVHDFVVPVALEWGEAVTVRIDPGFRQITSDMHAGSTD